MVEAGGAARDLVGFVLPEVGQLTATGDPGWPYVLLDEDEAVVGPVDAFFAELQACGWLPAADRAAAAAACRAAGRGRSAA